MNSHLQTIVLDRYSLTRRENCFRERHHQTRYSSLRVRITRTKNICRTAYLLSFCTNGGICFLFACASFLARSARWASSASVSVSGSPLLSVLGLVGSINEIAFWSCNCARLTSWFPGRRVSWFDACKESTSTVFGTAEGYCWDPPRPAGGSE